MPNDPQSRRTEDGTRRALPESRPPDAIPEEVAEPGRRRNVADAEWLSMATADPAHFLKDLRQE
jgi:hypothetical protein